MKPNPTVNNEKICPFMGVVPVSGGQQLKAAGLGVPQTSLMAQPCVKERCSLWDATHNQCNFITKTQNIEQMFDLVFKLVKNTTKTT